MTTRTTYSAGGFTATVVHDALPIDGSPLSNDIVLGPSGAAATLLHITPRIPFNRVWDLGCGSGVQSLIAAQHADHVVATDIDERALSLTQESAQLNGLNIETRRGSLCEPVKNEKFDLIISNPPFVIGGVTHLTHRESPLPADDLTRVLLEEIPQHLTDNGIAVMLVTWLITSEDWRDRFADWLPTDVGAWIALRDALSVEEYVSTWMHDAGITDSSVTEKWQHYLQQLNAREVGFGWIVLSKAHDFVLFDDVRRAQSLPTGDDVLATLAAANFADNLTAVQSLDEPCEQLPGPVWRQAQGLDLVMSGVWERLNGQRTLADIAAELAALWQQDEDDILVLSLVALKGLVALGFAQPARL